MINGAIKICCSHKTLQNPIRIKGIRTREGPYTRYLTILHDLQKLFQISLRPVNATAARVLSDSQGLCRICIGSGCLPRHTPSPKSPSALRRYQVPWSESRSLGQSLSRPLDWFLPVMQGAHRTIRICDGRLPNRHIWRHLVLAASTARTSMGAREVTASAGSGKSCCLLRWHPITVVGTGRHHWICSGATVAPLWHPLPLLPNSLQRLLELTLAQGVLPVSASRRRCRSTRSEDQPKTRATRPSWRQPQFRFYLWHPSAPVPRSAPGTA